LFINRNFIRTVASTDCYANNVVLFVEEKLLKMQYQMIAQKLAAIKVRKEIAKQQSNIGEEVEKRDGQLNRKIKLLEQTINMGNGPIRRIGISFSGGSMHWRSGRSAPPPKGDGADYFSKGEG
jgi:hypothetical protein